MRPLDPRLLPSLRPAAGPLCGVVAAGVAGAGLLVAQTFAVAHLVVVVVHGDRDGLASAALLVAAAFLGRSVVGYLGEVSAAHAAARVGNGLRHRLTQALLQQRTDQLSRQRLGELTVLLTRGVAAVEPYVTRYLPALVLAVLLPPLVLVAMGSQDLLAAAVVAVTLPLIPVFAVLVGLTTRERAARQWATLAGLAGHFVDVVRGLPTLVLYRRADAQSATIRRVTDRHRRATMATLRLAFASSAVLELVATLSVALVAVLVGVRLAEGHLELGTALVVLLLAPEAYWPLRRVGAEFHAAAEGVATFEAANRLLEQADEDPATAAEPVQAPVQAPWTGVDVDGLVVRYPGRTVPALDLTGRSLHLPARGLVALTGPSGSGKSTLLGVLAGETPAEQGRVLAAGRRLDDDTVDAWRASVSWVPQRPWLLAGSVRENLLLGRPDADDQELWAALDTVALRDLVAGLPRGLDAEVGEDGGRFSAGQRARLALARAVLARRPLVLVDEPTAHLDPVSAAGVVSALLRLAREATVLVVTHDADVVALADQEVRLVAAPTRSPAEPVRDRVARVVDTSSSESPTGAAAGAPEGEQASDGAARWLLSVGLGVLAAGCGVALTVTSGWLITRAAQHPPILFLMVGIVGVRAFGIGRPLLRYLERLLGHDSALRMLADRRARVYDSVVPLTPGALGRRRGDVLTTLVDDVDAVLDDRLRVRSPLLVLAGVGVAATVFAGLLVAPAGAVVAALLVTVATMSLVAHRAVRGVEADLVARRAELSDRVGETVAGARHLLLWQATGQAVRRVDRTGAALAAHTRRSCARIALARGLVTVAAGATVSVLALLAATAVDSGRLTGPWAAGLVLLPLALLEVLLAGPDAAATAARTAPARDRLAALAGTAPAVVSPSAPVPAPPTTGRLVAEHLGCGWEALVLADVTLQVSSGGRVGVVGPSGSGKSTLAATLVRFIDPLAGSVQVDGSDLRSLALDDVHRRIGLVDDDPFVFSSSVVENVRLADPSASRAEVESVLRTVSLGRWLDDLPDGLDTLVGEGHAAVSGGERARLGLARALLADQQVLVLDEPTAHLDSGTAAEVAADLLAATADRAVVWISHDGVAMDRMDRVVDLAGLPTTPQAGRVVGSEVRR